MPLPSLSLQAFTRLASSSEVRLRNSRLAAQRCNVWGCTTRRRDDPLQGLSPRRRRRSGARVEAVTPDTVAKILFTSGSTAEPKGVINTQRMLCSNQQAKAQVWPFLDRQPPVLVDWLPWNHTFGGNHNFNMVLRNGGTLYIDGGRPVPVQFARSLENLRDIAPTLYLNVPRGFELLIPALQGDPPLRERFFSRLQLIFYAAASLPSHLWDALIKLSVRPPARLCR